MNLNKMWYSDIASLAKVLTEAKNYTLSEEFGDANEAIGFNENSGNVYAVLDNWITICSAFGNDVFFLVTNYENGEEYEFDTMEEALEKQEELNNIN